MLTRCPELLQHKKRVLFDPPPPSSIHLTPIPAKLSFIKPFSTSIYHQTITSTNPPPCHNTITSQAYSPKRLQLQSHLLHQFNLQKCLKGAPKSSSANSAQPPPPPSTKPPLLPPPPHPRPPQAPSAPKSPSAPSIPSTTAATIYPTGALHQSVPPPRRPCRLLPVSAVPLTQWMAKATTSPANVTFSEGTRKSPK